MCERPAYVPALVVLCLFGALACALAVCTACGPLDNLPPCTGHEVWPDPCASAPARDGGR